MLVYCTAGVVGYLGFWTGVPGAADAPWAVEAYNSLEVWAAVLFVVESGMDIVWGLKTRMALAKIGKATGAEMLAAEGAVGTGAGGGTRKTGSRSHSSVRSVDAGREGDGSGDNEQSLGVARYGATTAAGEREATLKDALVVAACGDNNDGTGSATSQSRSTHTDTDGTERTASRGRSRQESARAVSVLFPSIGNLSQAHPLDRVDWDLWAAIFFFIPSIMYLIQAL